MPDGKGLTEYQRRRRLFDASTCQEALDEHRGNQSAAARFLGLLRNTFRKYLTGIDLETDQVSRLKGTNQRDSK